MQERKAKKLLTQVKKTYNIIAEEFSQSRQYLSNDFNIFKNYLKPEQKIVDLGCGNGRLITFLEKEKIKFNYTGIDNSEVILKEAQKSYPGYHFTLGDQLNIPLPDGHADILFNIRAFHHIPSKKLQLKALQEMKRVLKDDGILVVTVWNLWNKKQSKHLIKAILRSIFTLGQYHYNDTFIPWGKQKEARYYHAFTSKELKKLFHQVGLQIVESHGDKVFSVEKNDKNRDIAIIAKKITKPVTILDIPFSNITLKKAVNLCIEKLNEPQEKPFFIATPNPEMLLEAEKNPNFKKILQTQTDLNIPDGFGILLASKWQKTPLQERVTGADLMQALCENTPVKTKIFLLGAAPGVAEQTKTILQKKYPQIEIVGTHSGSPALEEEKKIINLINKSGAEMLFVAFGAPKQEMWLAKNLPDLQTVKIAMGVGGAFDFIAGIRKRAPQWMQKSGLEWLYRVVQEPTRIKRIFNATIKFPFHFLRKK